MFAPETVPSGCCDEGVASENSRQYIRSPTPEQRPADGGTRARDARLWLSGLWQFGLCCTLVFLWLTCVCMGSPSTTSPPPLPPDMYLALVFDSQKLADLEERVGLCQCHFPCTWAVLRDQICEALLPWKRESATVGSPLHGVNTRFWAREGVPALTSSFSCYLRTWCRQADQFDRGSGSLFMSWDHRW